MSQLLSRSSGPRASCRRTDLGRPRLVSALWAGGIDRVPARPRPGRNNERTEPHMSDTVGDFLLERLATWGVKRIYGYPGDGINGLMGAFTRSSNGQRPEFIQVRHEEMAAFMACAHAKFSEEEFGVCLATSGPGAIHLLNGLYDAKLDHQPVVAIVGQQGFAGVGSSMQQETDLYSLLKDVAADYIETVATPEQARHVIDRAFRVAH